MHQNNAYHIFTLPNGLKCVHWQIEGQVSYCGIAVNAGSRDEPAGKDGLAHFVEHTLFKGTEHHRSSYISNRMESIGGELNALRVRKRRCFTPTPPQAICRARSTCFPTLWPTPTSRATSWTANEKW